MLSEPGLVTHEPVPPPVTVGGLPISPLTRSAWARLMVSTCLAARETPTARSFAVFSANGQVLALSHRDKSYRALLEQADALDADGQPLVIISQLLLDRPLPERAATTDLFHDAARAACVHGLRFYFLGATAENIEIAVAAISRQYPALQIAGWRNGYFREADEAAICAAIVAASTDVLWVGLGVPHQEAFVVRNRERLRGVGWIKTCGGLLPANQPPRAAMDAKGRHRVAIQGRARAAEIFVALCDDERDGAMAAAHAHPLSSFLPGRCESRTQHVEWLNRLPTHISHGDIVLPAEHAELVNSHRALTRHSAH